MLGEMGMYGEYYRKKKQDHLLSCEAKTSAVRNRNMNARKIL
jgi:hypothetical protein